MKLKCANPILINIMPPKKTLVLKVDPHKPDIEKIRIAAKLVRNGGLVAFPTETVYGLGADALNASAVSALFKAKRRPLDNPPIVHIYDSNEVYNLAKEVPTAAQTLMKAFWPGPLTLIFKRSPIVPPVTVAGLDTIAIRMPKHKVALMLIKESKCPIAAPSANIAGRPSPTTAQHVLDDLDNHIDAVLDGGPTIVGVESTVLDLTADPPQILRPGGIPYEDLTSILSEITINPVVTATRAIPLGKVSSPGIKHKHYAPRADMIVVEGKLEAIEDKINQLVESYRKKGKIIGILATNQTAKDYKADVVKSLGNRSDPKELARNLFGLLRSFDADGVDVIIAEGVPLKGLGLAVMNRLRKAAGYRIVETS